MLYSEFHGKQISQLGFGAMRFPLLEGGAIDEELAIKMVLRAAEAGVNYFDTAYPYHGGKSEIVLGKALALLPRESFYLATKYPGHQIADSRRPELYEPEKIFQEQLEKCQVEYFDFYLLHNIYEHSMPTYLDESRGILDFFLQKKSEGKIKHLGFSVHGQLDCMREFLEAYGKHMEFCQIQLNYLDWTLQEADAKVRMCQEYNLPIIVMEPVRGGALAALEPKAEARLKELRPDRSIASWAFAWLQNQPVLTTLSGMSTMEQVEDNLASYEHCIALSKEETAVIEEIAVGMANMLPCTACRYCCDDCPQQLDIPYLLKLANDVRFKPSFNVGMTLDSLPEDKRPSACSQCGLCTHACPQGIDVPQVFADLVRAQEGVVHWADLIRQREQG